MSSNPIQNPGTPPIQPTPGAKPPTGVPEDPSQRPFSLPPEAGKQPPPTEAPTSKPTPMELAREGARQQQVSPEELSSQLEKLNDKLSDVRNNLQNPRITNNFTADHELALTRNAERMNPDLKTIAKGTAGNDFNPVQKGAGENVLSFITKWIDGSQSTLTQSIDYLASQKELANPADMMKVQYAVQRAVQRGELFSSIIGASVSGIKTLLSTQIG